MLLAGTLVWYRVNAAKQLSVYAANSRDLAVQSVIRTIRTQLSFLAPRFYNSAFLSPRTVQSLQKAPRPSSSALT